MTEQLPADSILYLRANGNYTWINYRNGTKILSSYTLSTVASRITKPANFKRIHRRYLVNTNYITRVSEDFLLLSNGQTLPIARRRKLNALP